MKNHIVSLSFDDGFAKSFAMIADIYEECGLKSCLNVISKSCEPDFKSPDQWHNAPTGTWDLWNLLARRGHEVMPHSYNHSNCAKMPAGECFKQIDMCLESFSRNLKGFKRAEAVFNFPYNSSTPEVEAYLLGRLRAVRTGGSGFNPWPSRELKIITTCAYGPDNCESHLEKQVEKLLAMDRGWLGSQHTRTR